MLDRPHPSRRQTFALDPLRLILNDRVAAGRVQVEDGVIVAVDTGEAEIDASADYLLPGLVDIHTDHFEKHIFPRPHVRWDAMAAALAHDAQMIGAGVTTVFNSICVGANEDNSERREVLAPIVAAIRRGRDEAMFRADHLLHLRCEVVDPQTPALLASVIDDTAVRVISVMDHTPGARQSKDIEGWLFRQMKATGLNRDVLNVQMQASMARAQGVAESVRPQVVAQAAARGLVLMSHDDATTEHIAEALTEKVSIAEFPTTLEAAQAARAAKLTIVAGAPNYVRGGSQSGNVAVRDLLVQGLVDILASDYVPRSMLDAAFRIGADTGLPYDLPAAIRLVTLAPARAAGLTDRGEIAPGQRADLLRVRMAGAHPVVVAAWREGVQVL